MKSQQISAAKQEAQTLNIFSVRGSQSLYRETQIFSLKRFLNDLNWIFPYLWILFIKYTSGFSGLASIVRNYLIVSILPSLGRRERLDKRKLLHWSAPQRFSPSPVRSRRINFLLFIRIYFIRKLRLKFAKVLEIRDFEKNLILCWKLLFCVENSSFL